MAKKLQMCGTEAEMRLVAARICRDYLHGAWKTVEPSELVFRRVSGGLSNFLYYVALPDSRIRRDSGVISEVCGMQDKRRRSCSVTPEEPKKVLLRIYGQVHGERALDAIVTESVIFTLLSERKLGPKLHGVFSGGRIEQYVPARPLLTRELAEPSLSMKIAEKMAAIHTMDLPLKKEPNWFWKTCHNWLNAVHERLANPMVQNNEEKELVEKLKSVNFENELNWLKKFLSNIDSPVVFCHNDMQEGNILLMEDEVQSDSFEELDSASMDVPTRAAPSENGFNHTIKNKYLESLRYCEENTNDSISSRVSDDDGEPRIVVIDYEYCAYNYRGFDIANHFQEWMYDYTNKEYPYYYENMDNLPTLEQKEIFIKQYLKHYLQARAEDRSEEINPSVEELNELLTEVEAFELASHFLWTLWSAVNATKSQITFGYWDYAVSRLEMYQRLKQEAIKKDKHPLKRKICEVDI